MSADEGPIINLFERLKDKICVPWEKIVIVKLRFGSIGYKVLCSRIKTF